MWRSEARHRRVLCRSTWSNYAQGTGLEIPSLAERRPGEFRDSLTVIYSVGTGAKVHFQASRMGALGLVRRISIPLEDAS